MNVSNEFFSSDKTLSELTTYQVGAIESAAHRSLRQYKDSLLSEYGITGIEWYLIGTVADTGTKGARITDLAEVLGTTLGFMTKTVNLLEAKAILLRRANAKDARSNHVIVSPKYRKTTLKIEAHLRSELRKSVYGLVTREELLTYIRVMEKFSKIK